VLGLFLTLGQFHWPLMLLGSLWGFSNSLYYMALHVDFSKIKHTEHGGREIGLAQSLERIGYGVGPVVGGILATFFGPQYSFLVAALVLFLGILPLLSTSEQVTLHRSLDFTKFKFRNMVRSSVVVTGVCIEDLVNSFYWPLFISLFALGGFAYAELGAISTVGFLASIVMARVLGQLTDRHKGRQLLQVSTLGISATYLIRPFLHMSGIAGLVNAIYQMLSVGVSLPFYKGQYDDADKYGENRVEYFMIVEVVACIVRSLICWTIVLLLAYLGSYVGLSLTFALAAVGGLAVLVERYRALD
jgi:MFS family permease